MLRLTPRIEIKVLDPRLEDWGLPKFQSEMAGAVDLHACVDEEIVLPPGTKPQLISSGIAVHLDNQHMAALILPRSGMGHAKGLVLGNLAGVVDADYLGPVMISAWNRNAVGTDPIVIKPGDRIAQMMFVPILRPNFEIVKEFSSSTERGAGGFGSTGGGQDGKSLDRA